MPLAVRDQFRVLRYRELLTAADLLAADLARRGVRPGQRVAVWLPSRIESVVALVACSRNGYVCCPSLHRDHTIGEALRLLARIRGVAMIWQDGYGADAAKNNYKSDYMQAFPREGVKSLFRPLLSIGWSRLRKKPQRCLRVLLPLAAMARR